METKPKVSIVVPVFNGDHTIGTCLDSLKNQTYSRNSYEIIVVDDGSTDKTDKVLGTYETVKVVSQHNQGPSAARNRGFREAVGDIILFIDADCEARPDWIEKMVEPLLSENGVVGSKGAYRTKQTNLMAQFVQTEYELKYNRLARFDFIDFVDTYSAGFNRSVVLKEGGFDPKFTEASAEDAELAYRLSNLGFKFKFIRDAEVYHRHPEKAADYLSRKFKYAFWRILAVAKHPNKIFRDTYTSNNLKMQMILTPLIWLSLLATPFFGGALFGVLPLLLLLLYISDGGLVSGCFRKGFSLGLYALLLIPLRATVQSSAVTAGTSRFLVPKILKKIFGYGTISVVYNYLVAMLLFVTISPIMFAVVSLVKLSSPGPILFRQKRYGLNGRTFDMFKFRTMKYDAEDILKKDEELYREYVSNNFKLPDDKDPRITRIGRFLRRTSLDELPQLINVFKGEMNMVGPRPIVDKEIEHYGDLRDKFLSVKPGITGLWQVSGRDNIEYPERVDIEMKYINNRSIWLDLKIMLLTIKAIIVR
ncbi:sugar transferase [candidate division KSB1 bacterium]